jgi:chorismate synthase
MHNNILGSLFSVQSFGESHGPAIGVVIDGVPPNITINWQTVQAAVNSRKTGTNNYSSSRQEADEVEVLSGYTQATLGTPMCLLIKNTNAEPQAYTQLKDVYRPGHADYTYHAKYNLRDYRGGGRSSIRITAAMVAAGEVARQILQQYYPCNVISSVQSIGTVTSFINLSNEYTQEQINNMPLRCIDADASSNMLLLIEDCIATGDTLGGTINTLITGLPAGIGSPLFNKLEAQLGQAMLSINTVMAFAYGKGFEASQLKGSQMNDVFVANNDTITTLTNNSGGIQGGISNGMPIYFTTAFKPISSIKQAQATINTSLQPAAIEINGRHDVCAVPRAIPIVNAYTYIVLLNEVLKQQLINK